jgi:hypothetical protein
MSLSSYRRDLAARKRELANLLKQRQKIDAKIVRLPPLISHLEGLCRELGDRAVKEQAVKVEMTTGLTELARVTLKEAFVPLSTPELKQHMETKGFDFSRYSNPLSSIHVVLQRLVKSGEVKVILQKGGHKAYQWLTAFDNLLRALETVTQVAQRVEGRQAQLKLAAGPGTAATSQSTGLKRQ